MALTADCFWGSLRSIMRWLMACFLIASKKSMTLKAH